MAISVLTCSRLQSAPAVPDSPQPPTLNIGFWLTPAFDFYALANALEPLRLANQLAGRSVCQWQVLSLGAGQLLASNGITTTTARLDQAHGLDVLILCGGDEPNLQAEYPDLLAQLTHWAAQPVGLGALGKAGWLLAQIGALDGFRCSLPEPAASMAFAAFSELTPVAAPFCVDRERLTCVGPQAVQGLMHELLARTHGRGLILRMEKHAARQARALLPVHDAPAKLQATLALMNDNLSQTLGIDELADALCVSRRHLERLFKRSLGCSPSRHYLDLRLQQARQLLRGGEQSLPEVARGCGFVSVQHFFRCYRQYFGAHPRDHMGATSITRAQGLREQTRA